MRMIWLAAIYAVGFFVVAAAVGHELEAKPVGTALLIVLWPILLPLAALVAGIGALVLPRP